MDNRDFSQKIEQVNVILKNGGREVIQKKETGHVQYGYKPQYVFDAVNEVIGSENWRYELVGEMQETDNQVIACVEVSFRIGDQWLSKGVQYGQSQIVTTQRTGVRNLGDAMKGAITDAIQKGFSLWSIGKDAYRGLLQKVYEQGPGDSSRDDTRKDSGFQNEKSNKEAECKVPKLDGIVYDYRGTDIIARGKTYGKSAALRAAGFVWHKQKKYWYRKAA